MLTMKQLTEKQKSMFEYIMDYVSKQGYPPTIRELGLTFGITPKGAYDHLKAIEKKGYVRCKKNSSRAIELLKSPQGLPLSSSVNAMVSVPLLGQVAAGLPLLAEENIEEYLSFPRSMLGGGEELFALRVVGDSMKDAGIFDHDVAIIKKQSVAKNGDIVVALLEDDATLKYFYQEEDRIRLQPANSQYRPIYVQASDVMRTVLLGKLVGVYRSVS